MTVLMQSRVSLFTLPGGDTVQALETMRALRRLGVDARISVDPQEDLRGYDLVHLFNLGRVQETAYHASRARRAGLPIVVSPIYWDTVELEQRGHSGARSALYRWLPLDFNERLRCLWRYCIDGERNQATLRPLLRGWRRLQRYVLAAAACVLPNSAAVAALIERDFGALKCPVVVVPNGVAAEFARGEQGERSGVVCVGRIEPRKNQLRLALALRGSRYGLSLVGNPNPHHRRYLARTLRSGDGYVRWLGAQSRAGVRRALARARVHALPSWFETPGLASLEAAAAGCSIVVTDRGSTREYFGDDAHYCDPASVAAIRDAVARAHDSAPNHALQERVLTYFTWERAAERTLRAYHVVLDGAPVTPDLRALVPSADPFAARAGETQGAQTETPLCPSR